jgi:hypothetical protein
MTTNLAAETRAIKRTLELLFGKDRVRVRRIRGTGADHPHIVISRWKMCSIFRTRWRRALPVSSSRRCRPPRLPVRRAAPQVI